MEITKIQTLIEKNAQRRARLAKLEQYYLGNNSTINSKTAPEFSPNNKVGTPFAEYITSFFASYLVGNHITVSGETSERLLDIMKYNDSFSVDLDTAISQSIFGVAWNLCWVDKYGQVRWSEISPVEIIPVYDGSLDNNLEAVIRHYKVDEQEYVEVYDTESITKYKWSFGIGEFIESMPHYFGDVPFIKFQNDKYEIGDFERVLDLIDAYDHLLSGSLDELDKSADAYLVLRGMSGTSAEDLATMRQARALLLGENDDAFFLEKTGSAPQQRDTLDRIDKDIHRFSSVPNLNDENLGSASGVAIEYRNQALDNKANGKEAYFRKGLYRRAELTNNILVFLGQETVDIGSVEFEFRRSLPVDESAMIDNIVKLTGLVPDEILLAQLPFIDDVQETLDMKYNAVDVEA